MSSSLKDHPFAVEAFFKHSLVLTFAAPKEVLQPFLPECLTLDTHDDQWGFLAVALVDTRHLRPQGFPTWMGNDFMLVGYRLFVRYTTRAGKRLRGLYILKSETNKRLRKPFQGVLLIVLSLVHVVFPKRFDWKNELKNLQLLNRQLMYVHTFFVALVVFLMGVLCLTSAQELVETDLGHTISFGMWVFWTFRLIFQFFVYSSDLWRGKRFETVVHVVFSLLWVYFSVVFLGVWRPALAIL